MKKYVPKLLRKPKKRKLPEKWGIGNSDERGDVGMSHGPFDIEKEALEIIGEKNDYIFHFLKNDKGAKIVWKWKDKKSYWKKI